MKKTLSVSRTLSMMASSSRAPFKAEASMVKSNLSTSCSGTKEALPFETDETDESEKFQRAFDLLFFFGHFLGVSGDMLMSVFFASVHDQCRLP